MKTITDGAHHGCPIMDGDHREWGQRALSAAEEGFCDLFIIISSWFPKQFPHALSMNGGSSMLGDLFGQIHACLRFPEIHGSVPLPVPPACTANGSISLRARSSRAGLCPGGVADLVGCLPPVAYPFREVRASRPHRRFLLLLLPMTPCIHRYDTLPHYRLYPRW